jgi:hypothetical protein
VTLTDNANNAIVSTHDEVAGEATLINHDTISGAGTIGDAGLTLDNYGDIDATGTANELILNTGTGASNAITNEAGATLEAQSGATLEIQSYVTNSGALLASGTASLIDLKNITVTNSVSGTVEVDTGSTIDFEGSTLSGGTLTVKGVFDSTGVSTFNGVTVNDSGVLDVVAGTLTADAGTSIAVSNGGTLEIDASAKLEISSAGVLTMAPGSTFGAGTGTLQIDSGGTLDSNGLQSFAGTLTDYGTVDVQTGTLTLSGSITGTFGSKLEISNGANLEIGTSFSTGFWQNEPKRERLMSRKMTTPIREGSQYAPIAPRCSSENT